MFLTCRIAELNNPFVTKFTYSGDLVYLEHVVVLMTVGVSNGRRGDLRVELTSPPSTTSILMDYRDNDNNAGAFSNWDFMSVHFWGENPAGDWTLEIKSLNSMVDMSGYVVKLYGTHIIPQAIQNIPSQCDSACDKTKGCAKSGPQYCDACASPLLRNSHTLECVTSCGPPNIVRNGYCYDPTQDKPTCQTSGTEKKLLNHGWFTTFILQSLA